MNRLSVFFPLAVIGLIALPVGAVCADGLIVQLPEDGAWATFDMHQVKSQVNRNTGGALGGDVTQDYTLKASSVGQTTVEGKPCRWLEFKLLYLPVESQQSVIWKVLIPEEQLKTGGDPTMHIVRGWVKVEDKPIAPIKDVADQQDGWVVDDQDMLRANMLPRPLQDSRKLDSKMVDCKAGKLNCIGLSGTTAWKHMGRDFQTADEIRLHDKSPFGVAFWDSQTEVDDQQLVRMTSKMTSTLSESGTTARSELPDHN